MRVSLCFLLLALVCVVSSSPRRVLRQIWSFPEDQTTSIRPFERPPSNGQQQFRPQPTFRPEPTPFGPERTTTRRQSTTTRRQNTTTRRRQTTTTDSGSTTTAAPGIIFQIPGCDCIAPPQYNPVCGTNGVSYVNAQKLNCARQCGEDVEVARLGTCATPRK